MTRLKRRSRPVLDPLEGRVVPAHVYPIGFIGPVEVGYTFAPPSEPDPALSEAEGGGYSNLGFPMPPPPVPAPAFTQMGMSQNLIGGDVGAFIVPASGFLIEKVEYTIDTDVVATQYWTNQFADYVKTDSFTHVHNPPAASDTLRFFWPEEPGRYTLTAKVTHNDVNHTVKTVTHTWNVAAPVLGLDPITVHGEEVEFGYKPDNPNWNVGFYQDQTPHSDYWTFDVIN